MPPGPEVWVWLSCINAKRGVYGSLSGLHGQPKLGTFAYDFVGTPVLPIYEFLSR